MQAASMLLSARPERATAGWEGMHRWPAKVIWEWLLSGGKGKVSSGMSVAGPKMPAIGCGRVQAIRLEQLATFLHSFSVNFAYGRKCHKWLSSDCRTLQLLLSLSQLPCIAVL